MDADEKFLAELTQFLTSYHIDSVKDVKSLDAFLKSRGVISLRDLNSLAPTASTPES